MTPSSFTSEPTARNKLKRGRKHTDSSGNRPMQRKSDSGPIEVASQPSRSGPIAFRTRSAKRKLDESCIQPVETSNKTTKVDGDVSETAEFTCGICFDESLDRGVMDCCDHKFCHSCIKDWLVRSSSCPHCKRQVTSLTRLIENGKTKRRLVEKVEKRLLRETLEREEGANFGRVILVGQLSYNRAFPTQRVQIDHDHVFNVLLGLRNDRAEVQMNPHQASNLFNSHSQSRLYYSLQNNNLTSLNMYNAGMLPVRYAPGRIATRQDIGMPSDVARFGTPRSGHQLGMLPQCQYGPQDLAEPLSRSFMPIFPNLNISSGPQFLAVDQTGSRLPDMMQNNARVYNPAIDYLTANAENRSLSAMCFPFHHSGSLNTHPLLQYNAFETERYSRFQGSPFFNAV